MAETNNGFMLFGGQRRLLARMDDTQKAALLDALYAFNDGEDVRPEDPLVDMAFMVIADAVRRCWERKEIFRENGSRGGRARRARSSEGPEGTDGNGEAGDGGSGAGAGPDKAQDFRARPLHDWTSHAADAFRYLAAGLDTALSSGFGFKPLPRPKNLRVV